MKMKKIAEACLWLPGFAPEDEVVVDISELNSVQITQAVIEKAMAAPIFPSVFVAPSKKVWPQLTTDMLSNLGGDVDKFNNNVRAIEVLTQLQRDVRQPTDDERLVLNRFTGWGGLPWAFNPSQYDHVKAEMAQELQALMTKEGVDYECAKASVNNAHFTNVGIVKAMWTAIEGFGFKGGNILEPSAGAGYFVGAMPEAIAQASTVTAIEIEAMSANLVSLLYGDFGVKVINEGFEQACLPTDFYDLAISNVPFGNFKVPELRNVEFSEFLIHDYFFARAIEVVRPGGLIAFITSSGTLDKANEGVRRYLAQKAKLLGAIRLPKQAFKEIANTEVVTDIIFLQKLQAGEVGADRAWLDVNVVRFDSAMWTPHLSDMMVNQWFINHPEMVVGKLQWASNAFGRCNGCTLTSGDVVDELKTRIALLPTDVYQAKTGKKLIQHESANLSGYVKQGAFIVIKNVLMISNGLNATSAKVDGKKEMRIRGMIEIRDAARKLISVQVSTEDDDKLIPYRMALEVSYDNFVAAFGCIHARANQLAFRTDPDYPLMLSLEKYDATTGVAQKADIFSCRTVGSNKPVTHCGSSNEAMLVSLAYKGEIDENYIAELVKRDASQVMTELENMGAIFMNPTTGVWDAADVYLSGDVKEKLRHARAAGQRFEPNVSALDKVQPADLTFDEIGVRLGSNWIPTSDYEDFIEQVLKCSGRIQVAYSPTASTWSLGLPSCSDASSIAMTQTYGTGRVTALKLMEDLMNSQPTTVYDKDPLDSKKQVVNQNETIAVRERQELLKAAFVDWVWSDFDRTTRLCSTYNQRFNCWVDRKYDGSHLTLPGFSCNYRLHKHQSNVIWRTVSSKLNVLMAHVVGAGKTLSMICSGMELRRLGVASKPCYVVPNHMLEQFGAEFLRAYPGANILLASKDDLQGDKRRELFSRIATGNWDAVLITHSSFELLKLSDAYVSEAINHEIAELEAVIHEQKTCGRGNRIVKELERAKKQLNARLQKLVAKKAKDDILTFEDLGIDYLFIDEAHLFKNLWRMTKMSRIAGLPNSNSARSFDMYLKTRLVMRKHDGKAGVVFATGTPLSNSMAEFWVMQNYLQPATLESRGVHRFDAWASNFGEAVTALELSPDGSGYRMHTRFARFVNLPELMGLFAEIADVQTAEMVNLPIPKARKEIVALPASDVLKTHVQELVLRSEKIRSGLVKPNIDNMLKVTNDGRKAALDMRLVDLSFGTQGDGKVMACAANVAQIWHQTQVAKSTQVVFCDLGTPGDSGRFSVYQALKNAMVDAGVNPSEIAFIHDYDSDSQKEALFEAVRRGVMRVLIGSTSKMGVGTNIQARLVALHHLDAPWRPSDIEQREGRILRQGNMNAEVSIYRYVIEGSFDSYIWQTLETKARFIAQVMGGNRGLRCAEDVELAALSYAEVKALASGNPMVMEKSVIDTEVARLGVLKNKWVQQQRDNRMEVVSTLPMRLQSMAIREGNLRKDLADQTAWENKPFAFEVLGVPYSTPEEAGRALIQLRGMACLSTTRVGSYRGLVLMASHYGMGGLTLTLTGNNEYSVGILNTGISVVRRAEQIVNDFSHDLSLNLERAVATRQRILDLEFELQKPFDRENELRTKTQRQIEINASFELNKNEIAQIDDDAKETSEEQSEEVA